MTDRSYEPLTAKDKVVYWFLRIMGIASGPIRYDWRFDWRYYLKTRQFL